MIISQWTAMSDDCPDCGDPFCMGCNFNVQRESTPREMAEDMRDYEAMRGNSQQMSEAEITAQMAEEAKPENNLFFGDNVASMDRVDEAAKRRPYASLDDELELTSDEEDAEVGRLWGIDASRTEGGE